MTDVQVYVFDCGADTTASAARDELLSRHGWVDVETCGPLLVWTSTPSGAEFSALVVSSVVRVMRLINPVPPTLGDR